MYTYRHFSEIQFKNYQITFVNFVFVISGLCLYLSKKRSDLDYYDCKSFKSGCPDRNYVGATIYECKEHYIINVFCLTEDLNLIENNAKHRLVALIYLSYSTC